MKNSVVTMFKAGGDRLRSANRHLIGAIEKGFAKARLEKAEIKSSLDLSAVPSYVAYRAALIREKMLLQYVCLGLVTVLVVVFVTGRIEVSDLTHRLRTKEFILAPGVNDFVPVSPQLVPDSYIQHAVSDFIATLGNTNPANIEERFNQLSGLMSPSLQIQFAAEAKEWIQKARGDNISEMITVLEKKIESDDQGTYRALVTTRTDTFIGTETIGYRNEVIEMGLRLMPPADGRRWYVEITSLSRTSADAFSTGKNIGGLRNGK